MKNKKQKGAQMTQQEIMKKQQAHKARNVAAGILFGVGSLLALSAAGTDDYRDEAEYENERVGYELYSTDDIASPKTTKAMTWIGLAALAGASALLYKNQKTR